MSTKLDETVRLQSEKRQEWMPEVRGERLQGYVKGTSSAPLLANLLAGLFPGKNECSWTHCSLILKEKEKTVPADLPESLR